MKRWPGPDEALFARHGSEWRVRLGAFAAPPPCSLGELRRVLAGEGPLAAPRGALAEKDLPDDLVATAAACGATTSLAFLDILDGGGFARAPCLCCYAAATAGRARDAGAALKTFLRYYSAQSFLESRAFARLAATLARDLMPREVGEVREFVAALDSTPDVVRAINAAAGLCVALPPCRPGRVWVYSTPAARRLLRHLSRKSGIALRVAVASSDAATHPRFRYRMYEVAVPGDAGADAVPRLLETAAAWARELA